MSPNQPPPSPRPLPLGPVQRRVRANWQLARAAAAAVIMQMYWCLPITGLIKTLRRGQLNEHMLPTSATTTGNTDTPRPTHQANPPFPKLLFMCLI